MDERNWRVNKIGFILGATEHGAMIFSRLDFCQTGPQSAFGVGIELFERGQYDAGDIQLVLDLIERKDGYVALDIGANVGVFTLAMSKALRGWGEVIAFEPQERIYYALAGNIAINNCWNARAYWSAVGDGVGFLSIPKLDYQKPASYGSLELKPATTEFMGQSAKDRCDVPANAIDRMYLDRVDFMKIDVEGMELDVLNGAVETIAKHRPIIFVEHIKCGDAKLRGWLMKHGYGVEMHGNNFVARP